MNQRLLAIFSLVLSTTALSAADSSTSSATPSTSAVTQPAAPVIKLGTGLDWSQGKYGFTQTTEVTSIPVNLSYDEGRWNFKATIPYISIKGPASVVSGGGGTEGAPRPTSNTESGLGDITLSGTFHARPVPGELNVDLTARVKFPTASESKGLGTGETDYYTQLDLYQNFGAITPFATLGYRFLGRNSSFALKDGAYLTAGAAYKISTTTVAGLAYDWRSRIISGAQNGTDGLAFVSVTPVPNWNFLGYLLVGFNAASPDIGVGVAATYKF